jgi:hypothetical protein
VERSPPSFDLPHFQQADTFVAIPSEVKTIKKYAFYYYNNAEYYPLESLEFPAGLSNIEPYAFVNCKKLAKIKMGSVVPPGLGSDFPSQTLEEIAVPSASLKQYLEAPVWANYSGIICPFSSGNSESFTRESWD